MQAPRSNVASWGEAGRQAGNTFAQIAETTRKYSPKYDELAKIGVQARAKEKQSAIAAEAKVRRAEISAETSLKKTDIEIDSKLAANKSKRKAGMVAAAGQMIGLGLEKDAEAPPATKAIDRSASYAALDAADARSDAAEAALGKSTKATNTPATDAPVQNKSTNTLGGPKSGGWNPLSSVIRYGEGTTGDRGYTTQFTGTQFSDMSKHPAQLRSGGGYTSDAAGAYQFLSTTYKGAKDALGLKDFSPESQEKAGRYLTQQRGVNPDQIIQSKEEFKGVMNKLAPEWASLPYSGVSPGGYGRGSSYYGQGGKDLDTLWSVYQQNLK